MNPRDLPEVVAELTIEMHEVRSELQGLNGRVDSLEQTMVQVLEEQRGLREDIQAMPERIGSAVIKSLEPFLNRLLDHDDQLKNHESRLNRVENPQA
jgi:ubiquinone biosynthesis protein UbiJ